MTTQPFGQDAQRKLLALCLDLVASVSVANLARRGRPLNDTLVDPVAIRDLADLLEEIMPGIAERVREERAKRIAEARERFHQKQVERAAEIDTRNRELAAERAADASRALPRYRASKQG